MLSKKACMHEILWCKKILTLEWDKSDIGLSTELLQARDGMSCFCEDTPNNTMAWPIEFASKSLLTAERWYSIIKWEALAIIHRLETFHHYYFTREACVITDHKSPVVIFKKDLAVLHNDSSAPCSGYTDTKCVFFTSWGLTSTELTCYQGKTTQITMK